MKQTLKYFRLTSGALLLGALAVLPAQAQYVSTITNNSPLDYWRLNDVVTSPAIDVVTNYGSAGAAGNGYVAGGVDGQSAGGIIGNYIFLANGIEGSDEDVGGCTNRVDIPNLAALNPNPPFTVEFWAMPSSYYTGGESDSTGLCPLSSDSAAGPSPDENNRSGYLFYVTQTTWSMRLGGVEGYSTTVLSPSGLVTPGAWTHVVGTTDGTNADLYINGVLVASNTIGVSTPFFHNTLATTRIGGTFLGGDTYEDGAGGTLLGSGNRGWDGGIDEVAIYTNVLASNVIYSHYALGITHPTEAAYGSLITNSHPVGYYNFAEPGFATNSDFTLALDIGSLDILGTNTLGVLADQPGVPGLSGDAKSVYYNGVIGSLVLDTNSAPYEFNTPEDSAYPPNALSLVAWIKPNAFGYMQQIITQGFDPNDVASQGDGNYAQNFLEVGDIWDWESYTDDNSFGDITALGDFAQNVGPAVAIPGQVVYSFGAYEGSAGTVISGQAYIDAFYPAPAGDIGNWVFIAGTYDPVNYVWNLYRNGTLVAQQNDYFGEGPVYVNEPWSVGSDSNPSLWYAQAFDGNIEEAAIFSTTLSATTISNLYQSVHRPPVITQAPVATPPVYLGSTVDLSVWAEGPGTLTYKWYSNGLALSDTATNLVLTGAAPSYDATYSVVVSNAYGSITSSVPLFVTPSLPPAFLTSQTRWTGFPAVLALVTTPNITLSYQWQANGSSIIGATNATYTVIAEPANDSVSYTLVLSNSLASATSSVATVTALTPPAGYSTTILGDSPIAYFLMNETNGTIGYDYAGGNNGNYYPGVELGQPGFSPVDPDLSVGFPGTDNVRLGDIGATSISFPGSNSFTIEAWANGSPGQVDGGAILVKGSGNNGDEDSEQFCFDTTQDAYRFFITDEKSDRIYECVSSVHADNDWHYLVGEYDGPNDELYFYVDGQLIPTGAVQGPPDGDITSTAAVTIGAEKSGPTPVFDWPFTGFIDQVAIYNKLLTKTQITNHYAAAYGTTLYPQIIDPPVSVTNYYGFPVNSNANFGNLVIPTTFNVEAIGSSPLSYYWYKVGTAGPLPQGLTGNVSVVGDAITIEALTAANAGTYTVVVSNSLGSVTSAPVTLTVIDPPLTTPSIPGLVAHLTFDHNLLDVTGRGNNATNMAQGAFALNTNNYQAGVLGSAFFYSTVTNTTQTNSTYATFGNRPDFQFGSGSFTVAMWVLLPFGYGENDLPFFCDVQNSTFGEPGFCFEPSYGHGTLTIYPWPGAWGCSVFDANGFGLGLYGYPYGSINDGNWHHLVYDVNTAPGGGLDVYLDGTLCSSRREGGGTVVGIGSINTTNVACIGQDPTGKYGESSDSILTGIDELCVFDRALTPFECETIYAANAFSQLSITGAPLQTSYSYVGGQLTLNWNEGYLQTSTNLTGPWTTLYIPSPAVVSPTNPATFYRVKF